MGWLSPVVLAVFASAVIALGVGVVAARRQSDPMAVPLAVLMFGIAAWALPDAVAHAVTGVGSTLLWTQLEYVGIVVAPTAYLFVALRYAGYERWFSWPVYLTVGAIPAVTLVLAVTSVWHDLIWVTVETTAVWGATVLAPEYGVWYWVNLSHAYLVVALGLFVLAHVAVSANPVRKKQAILMFVGGLVPLTINVAGNLGAGPLADLDLTAPALTVSGVTFALALFRYDVLDLPPAAYRNVPELFGDGVLVFDTDRHLVESNVHADSILDTSLTHGRAAADIFEDSLETVDGRVLSVTNGTRQFYELRHEPLRDKQERVVGHAVVLRDVTDLKEHEQRLDVTNRILRHNLRNELNVILGQTEYLKHALSDGETELEKIREATERLTAVGEKARYIRSSMEWDPTGYRPVPLTDTVQSTVADYRDRYPAATLTVDAPDDVSVSAPGPKAVRTVVANLVENALDHHDGAEPQVDVAVTTAGDDVLVRIADDGPGLPAEERDVLQQGEETQLAHGSGLGLWLVDWLVSRMGGTVTFQENDPRGTVVTVRLEPADRQHGEDAQTASATD